MNSSISALNRFGLGARPGEGARIRDPRGWLREQLDRGAPRLATPDGASAEEIGAALRAYRAAPAGDQAARRAAREALQRIALAEGVAALGARVRSERPFVERLVAFWSNHLCVSSAGRVLVAPLAGSRA